MTSAQAAAGRPTIRHVAQAAGVSKSLVSLAFKDPDKVSPLRRDRILRAAEELGYKPNFLARSLAAEHSAFVGILVADLHNPLFGQIADAARATLAEAGQHALLTSATVPDGEGGSRTDTQVLEMFQDLRPRAVLVIGTIPEDAALPTGTPVVYASALGAGAEGTVRSDERAGVELIVDHLVERGHERIAFVGGAGGGVSRLRLDAYRAVMAQRGLPEIVGEADYTQRSGHRAAGRLLAQTPAPSAIVAVNDLAALGVQARADGLGLRVPEDLAIAGVDNTSLAALGRIALTSLDPRNAEIGRRAARAVLAALVPGSEPAAEELIRPHLVVRSST